MKAKILFEVSVPGAQLRFFEIEQGKLVHDEDLANAYTELKLSPCGPNELKEATSDPRLFDKTMATHWKPKYPNSWCHAVYVHGKGGPLGSPLYGGGCFPPGTIFAGKQR
ncbi:MAG: hypothetical protein RL687_442 [Candidatus Parcubacteria bacterium]|jgi:hypothetical protein